MPRRGTALEVVLTAGLVLAAPATAAHASCAVAPTPSPARFQGTVVELEADGYEARVVLDSGRRVTVLGSPAGAGAARTSVDRRYALGGRYEFHPRNAASPFRDDACTATRQLAGPAPEAVEPRSDRLPAWLPVDEQAGPVGYAVVAVVSTLGAAVAGLLAVRARRRWAGGRS